MERPFGRNVGGIDRLARGVLAVVCLTAGGWALVAGSTLPGAVALAAGLGFGFNAVSGFCVANAVLGVDTCSRDLPDSG